MDVQLSVAVASPFVMLALVSAEHSMVTFGGQLITGGVISLTVIVWLQLAELPQASVAFQMRVMV